jgi:DNA repair photolyase
MPDGIIAGRDLSRGALDQDALAAFANASLVEPQAAEVHRSLARPGRGATGNPAIRYDRHTPEPFEDGWAPIGTELADLPPLPTTLTRDNSKTAISWNDSPDLGFDRAVNPYRGCEHGCVYCYARPSHAYLGYSPGLEFETQIVFKPNVANLLERELSKPGYVARPMVLGSNTDPYQPVDRTLRLTRSVLEVLDRFSHPVSIVTKSAGVLRDLDILQRMAVRGLVRVWLSITTLDAGLARRMEPRAASPSRRLQTIAALTLAGVPAGVLAAPMIPGLNDMELENILTAARQHGAAHAGYVLLRLPLELKDVFTAWLQEHVPDRARRVLALIRETRAGELNDSRFHHRFSGGGAYSDLLAQRFRRVQNKLGFLGRETLDTTQFSRPAAAGDQLSLL